MFQINAQNGEKTTYFELQADSLQLATGLLTIEDLHLTSHDLVMFFGDNSLQYVQLILAMAYLGLPVTPAKSANGPFEVASQLTDSKASVLCVSTSQRHLSVIQQIYEQNTASLEHLKAIIFMDDGDEEGERESSGILKNSQIQLITYRKLLEHSRSANGPTLAKIPHFSVNSTSDAYVIVYTSGSSGLPKGAIHSHRSFLAAILAMQASKVFLDSRHATFSFIYPFGHISGTILLANCFASSMTSVLFGPRPDKMDILEAVQRHQISFLVMFTALSADMATTDYTATYDLSSLRVFFFSGVKVPQVVSSTLRNRYGALVHELYGSTELMGGVSSMLAIYEPGNVGEPLPNVEMKITNLNTGSSLPDGKEGGCIVFYSLKPNTLLFLVLFTGEICLRAPNCFIRYLNNAKATAETIDLEGWYRTGDVGYYDHRGCLFITDRIKELIKYKHWSVSPAEVEAFLQTHAAVLGACVVGVEHHTEGAHLRAYVQLKERNGHVVVTEKEIVQYVKGLREYWWLVLKYNFNYNLCR